MDILFILLIVFCVVCVLFIDIPRSNRRIEREELEREKIKMTKKELDDWFEQVRNRARFSHDQTDNALFAAYAKPDNRLQQFKPSDESRPDPKANPGRKGAASSSLQENTLIQINTFSPLSNQHSNAAAWESSHCAPSHSSGHASNDYGSSSRSCSGSSYDSGSSGSSDSGSSSSSSD